MVEDELNEVYDVWKDKNFVSAIEKRSAELKNEKIKGSSWKEVKQKAKESINRKKNL
jgi:hypothetical protein